MPDKFDDLDRRIRLERATVTQDEGSGQNVETWGELITLSAAWRRASARETLASSEVSATASDVFTIRYASAWADLSPKDRLIYQGRVYDIASVQEIGRREGLRINALARAE